MRIGIDVRPIEPNKAGIGTYVESLVTNLAKIDSYNEYLLYSSEAIPIKLPVNFRLRVINVPGVLWHFFVFFDIYFNKIDVYHSTHSLILPILVGNKMVLTIHDLTGVLFPDFHSLKVRILYKLFLRLATRRSKIIIVPSVSTKKDLLGLLKVEEKS